MYSLQIALRIGERAHTAPGSKSGGDGVRDHFGQKEEKSSKKWSLQNLYLQIPREMGFVWAFAWKLPKASSPNSNKGLGSKHWKRIFNNSTFVAYEKWEKVQKRQYWDMSTNQALRPKQNGI